MPVALDFYQRLPGTNFFEFDEGYVGTLDLAGAQQLADDPSEDLRQIPFIGIWEGDAGPGLKGIENRGGVVLSSDDIREARFDDAMRRLFERWYGFAPEGDTFADAIYSLLTAGADPIGAAGPGLLMPGLNREYLVIAGRVLVDLPFALGADAYSQKVIQQKQRQLNGYREAAKAGLLIDPATLRPNTDYHLKAVDKALEEMTSPAKREALWEVLKPVDWDEDEEPVKHGTSASDDFNRANQSGPGTASGGFTYTNLNGLDEFNIVGNLAEQNAAGTTSSNAAAVDFASSNNFGQCDIVTRGASGANSTLGPFARIDYTASPKTGYIAIIRDPTNNTVRFYKMTNAGADAFTLIATSGGITVSLPQSIRMSCGEVAANTMRVYWAGAMSIDTTDTSYSTGLRSGIRAGAGGATKRQVDNFTAGDLVNSYTLAAGTGSFSLTGVNAGLRATRVLSAAKGTFNLTGNSASLLAGHRLAAATGSFTLSGVAAGLLVTRTLTASPGSFSLTGNAATLLTTRQLSCSPGAFSVEGKDADLVYQPVGSYSLAAGAGSFALTGRDAALLATRRLTASAGAFNLTGGSATLIHSAATTDVPSVPVRVNAQPTAWRVGRQSTVWRIPALK